MSPSEMCCFVTDDVTGSEDIVCVNCLDDLESKYVEIIQEDSTLTFYPVCQSCGTIFLYPNLVDDEPEDYGLFSLGYDYDEEYYFNPNEVA